MTLRIDRGIGAALGALAITMAGATGTLAQESTNRVAAKTDWSVFIENDPKECWSVAAPKETVNSKDGQVVAVRRGDILLFVTYRPGAAVGEVSFTGGYPFAPGVSVVLAVDGASYNLFPDGEWAWSGSAEEDAKIIASLKKGSSAVLSGGSARGTQTKDTFSLNGFTAAVDEAAARCAG